MDYFFRKHGSGDSCTTSVIVRIHTTLDGFSKKEWSTQAVYKIRFTSRIQKKTKYDRIHEALSQISLQEFIDKKVFTLSGGQQQKIALIRASLKPSELLLADEPTGSLDEKNREIILVTHDPYVADSCQRKVVIK